MERERSIHEVRIIRCWALQACHKNNEREREGERGRGDAQSTAKVILVRARHKSLKQTVRGKRNQFQVVKRERSNDRDVQRAEQGWSE